MIPQQSLTINIRISNSLPMSFHSVLPSPPRTPLSNLDIHGNTIYSPTPSPLYATAKTSLSKSLRRKPSQESVRSHLDNLKSSQGSAHSSVDNASILPSNSTDSMLPETESPNETYGGAWHDTLPRPATGVLLSRDDDSTMLTPTPKPRAAPPTPRSATPPALLLHDGLFITPPKATTHYPHVLEPITERASVATLRTSHSTLRQGSLSIPLGERLSLPARSLSPSLSNGSATSFTLSTPREQTLEVSPPPARALTPLTHAVFKTTQTVKPGHLPGSPPRLRDRFLLSAAATPAERDFTAHTARLPHEVVMPGRERRTEAPLSAARLKAAGRIPDGHYHPWNMLARRRLQQQQTTSGEKEKGVEGAGNTTVAMAGMRMGMDGRHSEAGRKTGAERGVSGGGAGATVKDKFGERVRSGKKRNNKGWDKFWGKMAWVCCVVQRAQWEEGDRVRTGTGNRNRNGKAYVESTRRNKNFKKGG